MGKKIDIDAIRLKNETVIAVGNMKVNARGDQLGAGGKIVKTRDQLMKEYYALNTPVAQEMTAEEMQNLGKATAPIVKPLPADQQVSVKVDEAIIISENSGLDEEDFTEPVVVVPTPLPPAEAVKMLAPKIVNVESPVAPPQAPVVADVVVPEVAPAPVADPAPTTFADMTPKYGAPGAEEFAATKIRGNLANSVAPSKVVTQTAKLPPNKANGVQRF
jgi:hypothetical protein